MKLFFLLVQSYELTIASPQSSAVPWHYSKSKTSFQHVLLNGLNPSGRWMTCLHPLYTPTVPDKSKTKEGVFSFRVDSEAKQHIAMYCGETEVGKRENGSVQRIFLIHLH